MRRNLDRTQATDDALETVEAAAYEWWLVYRLVEPEKAAQVLAALRHLGWEQHEDLPVLPQADRAITARLDDPRRRSDLSCGDQRALPQAL